MIVTVKKQLQRATRHMVAVAAVLAIMVAALAFPFTEVTPPAQAQTAPAQPQNPDLDLNKMRRLCRLCCRPFQLSESNRPGKPEEDAAGNGELLGGRALHV